MIKDKDFFAEIGSSLQPFLFSQNQSKYLLMLKQPPKR